MDGNKFAEMLVKDVFPAIRKKMKWAKVVKVQWDNAGGHGVASILSKIQDHLPAPVRGGPKIELVSQCAQSPETNTLDLGFNKALDSTLPKLRAFEVDEFETQIMRAWKAYPEEKIDGLYNMKQRIVQCILKDTPPEGNNFPLPHRKKDEK
jgi:hypothetical protein